MSSADFAALERRVSALERLRDDAELARRQSILAAAPHDESLEARIRQRFDPSLEYLNRESVTISLVRCSADFCDVAAQHGPFGKCQKAFVRWGFETPGDVRCQVTPAESHCFVVTRIGLTLPD